MNKLLLILSLFCVSTVLSAQVKDSVNAGKYELSESPQLEGAEIDKVYPMAEVPPKFPGGQDSLVKFLIGEIHYPAEAKDAGIHGTVSVRFVVKKDGSLDEVEIARGVHPILDAEALRVIKSMPNWIPGTIRNAPVNVQKQLPIQFMVMGGENETPVTSDVKSTKSLQSYGKGKELMQEEKYAQAEVYFTDALTMLPSVDTYYNRALCRLGQGNERGYCADMYAAARMGDKESEAIFEEKCKKYPKETLTMGSAVEQQASYPGGPEALEAFINKNKVYPEPAKTNGVKGTVNVIFTVGPDGKINDISVAKPIEPSLDAEAMRIVSKMPNWIPGKMNGKYVGVRFNLPITF